MQYAKVEGGIVVSTGPRPNWRTDAGELVDDARLAQDGWLPVVGEAPEHDHEIEQAIPSEPSAWTVASDHVEVVYTVEALSPEAGRANRIAGIVAERSRRLAAGFDYDFGDGRGVHRIGTTAQDMVGWDEVTKLAQARIATASTTPIAIVTETGPTTVTPLEWMAVLEASAAFRQPLWAASFALQAMQPIPADYADDAYWEP